MTSWRRFTWLPILAICACRSAQDYRKEADETGAVYLSAAQQRAVCRT